MVGRVFTHQGNPAYTPGYLSYPRGGIYTRYLSYPRVYTGLISPNPRVYTGLISPNPRVDKGYTSHTHGSTRGTPLIPTGVCTGCTSGCCMYGVYLRVLYVHHCASHGRYVHHCASHGGYVREGVPPGAESASQRAPGSGVYKCLKEALRMVLKAVFYTFRLKVTNIRYPRAIQGLI